MTNEPADPPCYVEHEGATFYFIYFILALKRAL